MLLRRKDVFIRTAWMIAFIWMVACQDHDADPLPDHDKSREPLTADEAFRQARTWSDKMETDTTLSLYLRASSLYSEIHDTVNEMRSLLMAGDIFRQTGDNGQADSLLAAIRHTILREEKLFRILSPELFFVQGALYKAKGYTDSAVASYTEAIRCQEAFLPASDTLLIPVYNNLGNIFYVGGDHDQARLFYEKGLEAACRKKAPDRHTGLLYQNAALLMSVKNRYEDADDLIAASLKIFYHILDSTDYYLAFLHNIRGSNYLRRLNYWQALEELKKAERIAITDHQGISCVKAEILHNLGVIFHEGFADYQRAIDYYKRAHEIFRKHPSPASLPGYPSSLYSAAKVCHEMGDFQQAEQYIDTLIDRMFDPLLYAKALLIRARINTIRRDYTRAGEDYRQSVRLFRSLGEPAVPSLLIALNSYGYALSEQKDHEGAISQFLAALKISRNAPGNLRIEQSVIHGYLARIYLNQFKYDDALQHIRRAIRLNTPDSMFFGTGIQSGAILSNPFNLFNQMVFLHDEAKILLHIAQGTQSEKLLQEALVSVQGAVDIQAALMHEYAVHNDEQRMQLEEEVDLFSLAMEIVALKEELSGSMDMADKLFGFMEGSRNNALLTMVKEGAALKSEKIPVQLKELEQSLMAGMYYAGRQLNGERMKKDPDQRKMACWESLIGDYRRRHDSLSDILRKRYPRYRKTSDVDEAPALSFVQRHLSPDVMLVEYALVGDSALFIVAATKAKKVAVRLRIDKSFLRDVQQYRRQLAEPDLRAQSVDDLLAFQQLSNSLYLQLLHPVMHLAARRRLLIIPDGLLSYIPFETLVTKVDTGSRSYRDLHYLIRQRSVAYAYSYKLNLSLEAHFHRQGQGILAMAPGYREGNLSYGGRLPQHMLKQLTPLDGSVEEVSGIRKEVGRLNLLAGKDATEAAFRKYAGRKAIIHLAMHSLINDEDPLYSQLIFSDQPDTVHDNLLHAYEIFQLDLNAGMVVLSACNTGYGDIRGREGVISLTRGFFQAGVPTVVMSHWSMEDLSGGQLLPAFYKELACGEEADEALRKAKLSFIKNSNSLRAHPFFWSPLVVYGSTDVIAFRHVWNKTIPWVVLLLIFTISTGSLLLWRDKRLRKKPSSKKR